MPIIALSKFFDDVRFEVGNKISLMGEYTGDMIFSSLPYTLPKLCIVTEVYFRLDEIPPRVSLEIELDGVVVHKWLVHDPEAHGEPPAAKPHHTKRWVGRVSVLSPLVIEKPGSLRVYTDVGDERLPAGALEFVLAEQPA